MYKKVYIIDDDEISIFLTQTMLEVVSFAQEYKGFLCGKHALEQLNGVLQTEQYDLLPDVIFLDLNMPMISGWEVLERLTPHTETFVKHKCRIYILTSSVDVQEQVQAQRYRLVKGFINKPLEEQDIADIILSH